MKIKKFLIFPLVAILLSGCASTGNQKLGKMTAAEINNTFHKGMTKKQVIALLGAPTRVQIDSHKNDVWYYSYTKSHLTGKDLISFFRELHRSNNNAQVSGDDKDEGIVTSDKTKQLVFVFHNKKVIQYKQIYGRGNSNLGSLL